MIVTRIEADVRAVIPTEVLNALAIKPGDEIGFNINDGVVSVFRNPSDDEIDGDTGLTYGALRALIKQAVDDPRPSISADEAFANVRRLLEDRWAADDA